MLKKYLEKIGKIKVGLIKTLIRKNINGKDVYLNPAIFGDSIPDDLYQYKIKFNRHLNIKTSKLLDLLSEINKDKDLFESDVLLLNNEISFRLSKLEFLRSVYDIEANKIDPGYLVIKVISNYDYYNKIFYGVTKQNLDKKFDLEKNISIDLFFSRDNLLELINYSKVLGLDLYFRFGNYKSLSHDNGVINIPDKLLYNIKDIIVIFFHEMTHYFRHLNGIRNLGFSYYFSDYENIEEGIAQYNEYYYGNKICNYGKHSPFYDICYKVCLMDIIEEEKKDKIYKVLKNKGFNREKTDYYYYRFYKYTKIGGKDLFLKDMIYTNAYNNVIELLKDKASYEKIMAGKIGTFELENDIISSENNFNTKDFFKKITNKIIEIKDSI